MTHATAYKLTFMQKLLGRNYKWWYATLYNFKLSYEFRLSIFIAIVRFFIPVFITYILLSLTNSNKSFSNYTVIASIYYQFFAFVVGPSFDITNDVLKGSFSRYLLYPIDYLNFLWTKIIGFNLLTLIFRLIILFITIAILSISFNWLNFIYTAPFIALTIFIGYQMDKLIGIQVFFQQQLNKNLIAFYYDLMPFLSGSLLAFSISSYLEGFKFTPMAYFAYHPMQIYLGKYDFNQTLMVFAGGIAWCVVLYFLAKWIFKMGLKRNEAVGL